MKKTLVLLLAFLTALTLFVACGKGDTAQQTTEPDANAVLTDSDVPLDLGAEVSGEAQQENAVESA